MPVTEVNEQQFEEIQRLTRDQAQASQMLERSEARFLVDQYYQIQEYRKASANQFRAVDGEEPNRVLDWIAESTRRLEDNIKKALGHFSSGYRVGNWLQAITGIGPVISAGLLTHLQINPWKCIKRGPKTNPKDRCHSDEPCSEQCVRQPMRTAGHFWRFAGLDPTMKWEKGQLRPWNAKLKVLVWKAEDCFVKFQNHKNDYYGKLYVRRKEYEQKRNEAMELKEYAAEMLRLKNFGKETEARKWYEKGMLPPGHIHSRAMRWTGKMLLSHLHHVMYVDYFGEQPPVPYAFEKLPNQDHRHFIDLPNPFPGDFKGKNLKDLDD